MSEAVSVIAASAVVAGILISTALLSRGSDTSLSTSVNDATPDSAGANNLVQHGFKDEAVNQGPSNEVVGKVQATDSKSLTLDETISGTEGGSKVSNVDEVILKLWRNGMPVKEIAKEVGLSTSTIYRKLRKLRTKY